MARDRLAVLLDGAFVTRWFEGQDKKFPTAQKIEDLCTQLCRDEKLATYTLYRIFFHDAEPYAGAHTHPVTGVKEFFPRKRDAKAVELRRRLERTSDFTVRRGETIFRGWTLKQALIHRITKSRKTEIVAGSVIPNIAQKGVDMRIGLDVATLALKRLVQAVLIVTCDTDMIPAMRFARREGLRVYLCTLGSESKASRALAVHADVTLPSPKTLTT